MDCSEVEGASLYIALLVAGKKAFDTASFLKNLPAASLLLLPNGGKVMMSRKTMNRRCIGHGRQLRSTWLTPDRGCLRLEAQLKNYLRVRKPSHEFSR